jgi:GTP-binding protein Era
MDNPTQNILSDTHKAGFVSLIGKPNVGKSTLMNQLIGERLSIITSKAQTTRHRIMGIINGADFQIVYSDTPGILNPKYELQKVMMSYVHSSLEDADVILWVTDLMTDEKEEAEIILPKLTGVQTPVFLLMNKADTCTKEKITEKTAFWQSQYAFAEIFPISALKGQNVGLVLDRILERLPVHPPFYPQDELTDRSERFFASEIIREKIFLNYEQEIPYACEVLIQDFKDKPEMLVIRAEIIVERDSQKGIVIGRKGESLKKVGIQAREELEKFFGKKVFLEQHVKVEKDWRKRENKLGHYGYGN